jgi:hypothetical protein
VLPIAFAATLAAIASAGCSPKFTYVDADALCKSWKHQTVSKDDKLTQDTAAGIEGSNKSRPNFQCVYGENAAKS